ncbi:MAG: prepilin-type N-terminal cleavage/methylation domain-containing protein [Planctomycetes bacterium]|nr:prepilin-type N-terminal cleavage/methylation domain-containing protein [Planctomycetota bacterium]
MNSRPTPCRVFPSTGARPLGCRRGPRSGFTLIELLVVVSILSLLIAILLPSLRGAREQSKRVVCQANLRQIALGWHDYLDQYGGAFLQGINVRLNYGGRQGTGSPVWGADPAKPVPKPLNRHLNLPPVVRDDAEVFRCPSDRGSAYVGPTHFDYYGTSYHTNVMLVGQSQIQFNPFADPCRLVLGRVNDRLRGIKRSWTANDGNLILIGDHGWYDEWDRGIPCDQGVEWHHRPQTHNVAFMDGHASFVRIRKGIHVTTDYVVIPFKDLVSETAECQEEVDCD